MKVTVRKNRLYFDEEATDLIQCAARQKHRTFKQVVIAALKRGIRNAKKIQNIRS